MYAMDRIGKENTTRSLMDWKTTMFNQRGVKIMKMIWSISRLLLYINIKLRSWEKFEAKGHNMHNHEQFMISQNQLYNSSKWISNVIFPPSSNVFEAHLQEPLSKSIKSRFAMDTLVQNFQYKICN